MVIEPTRRVRCVILWGRQPLAPVVPCGAAVGSTRRGTCARPSATGSAPASAMPAWASVPRVQKKMASE